MIEVATEIAAISGQDAVPEWRQQVIANEDADRFNQIFATANDMNVEPQNTLPVEAQNSAHPVNHYATVPATALPTGLSNDYQYSAHNTLSHTLSHEYSYADGDNAVSVSLVDKISNAIAAIGSNYNDLFSTSDTGHGLSTSALSNDGISYQLLDGELLASLDALREMQLHASNISMWSAQTSLLTSSVSKSTQGIHMLFKNNG